MEKSQHIRLLFYKHLQGVASAAEVDELLNCLDDPILEPDLKKLISQSLQTPLELDSDYSHLKQLIGETKSTLRTLNLSSTSSSETMPRRISRKWFGWSWAAASILFILGLSLFFAQNRKALGPESDKLTNILYDIQPGGQRAELIFSDGTRMDLLDSDLGLKLTDSALFYADGSNQINLGEHAGDVMTISTPRGGNYALTLSDGSKVWLNAASTLTFPKKFTGATREVQATGEVYFKVTHDPSKVFLVHSMNQKIAVLGTEFNLNAYSEENRAVTTLIEGSVFVSDVQDRRGVTLRPGQQSIHDGTDFTTVQVDVALAKAWKDGIIIFNEADLKAVIQQIERWYDVTFEYQSLPKTETVYGQVSRNSPLSEILHSLEINYGVKFKVEGRRIMLLH